MADQKTKATLYMQDAQTVRSVIADSSVDLIITGPPYFDAVVYSDYQGELSAIPEYQKFLDSLHQILTECAYTLKPGGILAMWAHDLYKQPTETTTNYIPLHADFIAAAPKSCTLQTVAIWDRYVHRDKGTIPTPINSRVEYILIFRKVGTHTKNHTLIKRSIEELFWHPIWHEKTSPKLFGSKRLFELAFTVTKHPIFNQIKQKVTATKAIADPYAPKQYGTETPQILIERLITKFTKPFDTILDPFVGSGTTLAVANRLKRNSIAFEINRKVLPVIERKVGKQNFDLKSF